MSAPWLSTDSGGNGSPGASRRSVKPRKADPVAQETRDLVRGRSGGICELGGCQSAATHVHHRQLRRFGNHTALNLLHTCSPCHTRIHGHVRYSLDQGWIVSQYDDPALREVLINNLWVWLGAAGELLHMPPVGEPPC